MAAADHQCPGGKADPLGCVFLLRRDQVVSLLINTSKLAD